MAITHEKIDTRTLERTGSDVYTDVYNIRFTKEDAPKQTNVEEKEVNGRTIGCPNCNTNTFAFFKNNQYICSVCLDHSAELTESDLKKGFYKDSL